MNIKGISTAATEKGKKQKRTVDKRHLKYGSLATALTALFIVAVILVNIVVTMLFERFPISLDLTGNNVYTVSEETKAYISGIDVPVEITVISTEGTFRGISDYTVQCAELLDNYTQYNPNITVSYKDLLSNPDFVANYSAAIADGDIIVELGNSEHKRVKVITLADIINVPEDYESYLAGYKAQAGGLYTHRLFEQNGLILSSNAEQALTSAIMTVTDANPITVATLKYPGANESDVSGLTGLLDKNGYMLTNINIQTEDIGSDVDIIIIPAPKIDYTVAEIDKISEWLSNDAELGKDIIYIASAEQAQTPNLDGLLYKYGITVEQKTIYETDRRYYSNTENFTIQSMASDKYKNDIANPNLSLFVPNARAISTRFKEEDGYNSCEILVKSSNNAVLRPMYGVSDSWTAEDAEERGSFVSVALGKYKALNQETHISRYTNVVVVGSDMMVTSSLMSAPQLNNGDFFLSLINELTGKTEGVTIVPKALKAKGVLVNDNVKNSLNLTFAVIIPLIVIVAGVVVWVRRRHM